MKQGDQQTIQTFPVSTNKDLNCQIFLPTQWRAGKGSRLKWRIKALFLNSLYTRLEDITDYSTARGSSSYTHLRYVCIRSLPVTMTVLQQLSQLTKTHQNSMKFWVANSQCGCSHIHLGIHTHTQLMLLSQALEPQGTSNKHSWHPNKMCWANRHSH